MRIAGITLACVMLCATSLPAAELMATGAAMLPGTTAMVQVDGNIAGESTFGYTILLEIVPRPGNLGTLEFTASPPVDIVQLGDPWPGGGGFSPFDTDPAGSNSPVLNGVIDDSGTGPMQVDFAGPLAGFPIVASADADGTWDVTLSTFAGDASWEGLGTTLIADTVVVSLCGDGQANLGYFARLSGCLEGPLAGLGEECPCFDGNDDGDLDLRDFAVFQRAMTE